MTTEFHGDPVAGGTYPALIWKAFMQKVIVLKHYTPESFPYPPSQYAAPVYVVNRGGILMRDNGTCKNAFQLAFYGGLGPAHVATCKPNEVVVPAVVGTPLSDAKARLQAQPLNSTLIYRPAHPGERLGVVVNQFPRNGTASAYDTITLVLPKSLHGSIPKVVGLPVSRAQKKLERLKLDVELQGPSDGRVVKQSPAPGTAAGPGLRMTLSSKP